MVLEQFFGYLRGKRHGAKMAMRELEISMRAKDPVTPVEDTELYSNTITANAIFLLTFAASGSLVWFATRKVPKFPGIPPLHILLSLSYSFVTAVPPGLIQLGTGCGTIFADMMHYEFYHGCATDVLKGGEESMKMELAKIILDKHSTDELLVEAVKRHFIAENLLSDQHQEQRLFRWRQRNSYVDHTFKERMKESEANSSDEEAESSVSTRLFEEDSLACILGVPDDDMEMSKPAEHTRGLRRRELHVHRRSHRGSTSQTC